MNGIAAQEEGFPVSRCARCGRDVLLHVDLDPRDEECWLCLHCDAEIDPDEVRWVEEAALAALGYGVAATGGCGKPGCGQGRCGRG